MIGLLCLSQGTKSTLCLRILNPTVPFEVFWLREVFPFLLAEGSTPLSNPVTLENCAVISFKKRALFSEVYSEDLSPLAVHYLLASDYS